MTEPVEMTDAERDEWVAERHSEGWKDASLDHAPRWKCRGADGIWRYGVSERAARIRARAVCRR